MIILKTPKADVKLQVARDEQQEDLKVVMTYPEESDIIQDISFSEAALIIDAISNRGEVKLPEYTFKFAENPDRFGFILLLDNRKVSFGLTTANVLILKMFLEEFARSYIMESNENDIRNLSAS